MVDLLSDDQILAFKEKGVTVLRGVFTDWVEVLRAGVDANMADPDPNARIYKGENGADGFLSIIVIGRVSRNIKISYLIPTPPLVPR